MEIKVIKKIINLFNKNQLNEIEVKIENKSIKIVKYNEFYTINEKNKIPNINNNKNEQNIKCSKKIIQKSKIEYIIKSPIVGTFYRSNLPNEKSFINTGDIVKKNDILCIIEAMKMLNQIKSEKAGTIKSILVENGQHVEFNQPIIIIEIL